MQALTPSAEGEGARKVKMILTHNTFRPSTLSRYSLLVARCLLPAECSHIVLVVRCEYLLHRIVRAAHVYEVLLEAVDSVLHIASRIVEAIKQFCLIFLTVVMEHSLELAEYFILGLFLAEYDLVDVREIVGQVLLLVAARSDLVEPFGLHFLERC